jgi:hypothetical protein
LLAAGFLFGAPLPDWMLFQLVQNLVVRTETLYGFPVMVRPSGLSALRRRNSIGSSGSADAASSINTSSAVMVCTVP